MMLKGIRTVLDELTPAERAKLSVVAFSLSPETDTKELRTMITQAYHFDSAQFNFLNGQPEAARIILRDLVNATVGFEGLASATAKPSKSLHRMLSLKGNPSMDNLAAIFGAVRKELNVGIKVETVEMAS